VKYALQANYCISFRQFRRQKKAGFSIARVFSIHCFSPTLLALFNTRQSVAQAKKMRAGQEGKTVRAKDWTMVVASESHLIFSLPPPCDFATREHIFLSPSLHRPDTPHLPEYKNSVYFLASRSP